MHLIFALAFLHERQKQKQKKNKNKKKKKRECVRDYLDTI